MVYFAHCKFRKESCRTLYTIIVCALLLFLPAGSMQGPVNSMFSCPYGILSGGKDRRVRMWTHKLEPGVTFDCSNYGYNANIRSTCLSSDGQTKAAQNKIAFFQMTSKISEDLTPIRMLVPSLDRQVLRMLAL